MNAIEISKKFPRKHLVAACVGVITLGIALLLPSEDVAANKSQITLELKSPALSADLLPIAAHTQPVSPIAKTSEPQAKPKQQPEERWLRIQIRKGDNLTTLFKKAGLDANDMYPLLNGIKPSKALNKLKPGEFLEFVIDKGNLRKVRHAKSPQRITQITKTDQGYRLEEIDTPPQAHEETAESPRSLAGKNAPSVQTALQHAKVSTQDADQNQATASAGDWLRIQIRKGDNLTTLFKKAGLGANEMYPLLNGIKPSKALKQLKPGEFLEFVIDKGELRKVRHTKSPLLNTLITKSDQGYRLEEVERTPDLHHVYRHGTIDSSLFLAGEKAGLSQKKIMELATIFGWDVDFALDIRGGDSFSLIYEELFLDGDKIGDGEIIAAEFTNQGKSFQAIRYTDSKNNSNYFTPDGKSMRKAFLRTPVDFARISSRFNPNRKHPIFKTKRPHRGVDYAAPTGTPIKSAGDGKVIFAGKKGGYGKAVVVQHGQTYTTLYAHMTRIKPGMRRGKRVKQGQTIGYVGSTGYATGPHLHYEFRVNGVHRNPLTVPLPQAAPLPKKERAGFAPLAKDLLAQLETFSQTQLASQ